MKLIHINEYRTEALISKEELVYFGITYEELDYANDMTKHFLRTVLNEAQRHGLQIIDRCRLLIEVMKPDENTVRVIFTVLPPKPVKYHLKKSEEYMAVFSDIKNLKGFAMAVCGNLDDNSLYEDSAGYYLFFCPKAGKDKGVIMTATEYADFYCYSNTIFKAKCRERFKCSASENAIKKITGEM